MLRFYELILILRPDLEASGQKKLLTKIRDLVKKAKGKIEKEDSWGEKLLAYPIKKQRKGIYFLWQVSLRGDAVAEIEKKILMEEDVLRYLIIKS